MISVQREWPCTGQKSIVAWMIHYLLPKPDIKGHPVGFFSLWEPFLELSALLWDTLAPRQSHMERLNCQLSQMTTIKLSLPGARCLNTDIPRYFQSQMFEARQPFGFLARGPQISGAEVCHSAVVYAKFLTHKTLEHNPMVCCFTPLHLGWCFCLMLLLASNNN